MSLLNSIRFIVTHPLSTRPVHSVSRFAAWQISNRIFRSKRIIDWIDDARIIVELGETGLTGNIYVGLAEYEDMAFLLHYLTPGINFVDVGANVGAYTILASKVCGCRAIAFEPVPATYARLLDQLRINDLGDLAVAMNCGVGDRIGSIRFTTGFDTTNHVVLEADDPGVEAVDVDVVTLDSTLSEPGPYVLKIDVEGFEMKVIEGAAELLRSNSVDAIVIELNGSGAGYGISDEEIHQRLRGFGFVPIRYDPRRRLIRAVEQRNTESGNTLYVRDVAKVAAAVQEAPPRSIHTAGGIRL